MTAQCAALIAPYGSLEDVGIAVVLETRHGGWADIEVGGPGFGAMPVWRWNGSAYQRQAPAQ